MSCGPIEPRSSKALKRNESNAGFPARPDGKVGRTNQKERTVKRLAFGAILATLVAMVVKRLPLDDLRRRLRPSLADLTKGELYHRAQEADIQGRGHMSKDELIAALKEV
jgi:hypothetical protein